jgi:hypothetical protein
LREAFLILAQYNLLTIGGVNYSADELCAILNEPVRGTYLGLAHQLIAALINIELGAGGEALDMSCIDAEQTHLANYSLRGTTINNNLTDCLADFNESSSNNFRSTN